MLVGNKSDLENSRKIPKEMGELFAEEEGLLFGEASAKTGEGVEGLFMEIGTFFPPSLPLSPSPSALCLVRFLLTTHSSFFPPRILPCLATDFASVLNAVLRYGRGIHVRGTILMAARKLPLAPPKPTPSAAGKVKVTPGTEATPSACNC